MDGPGSPRQRRQPGVRGGRESGGAKRALEAKGPEAVFFVNNDLRFDAGSVLPRGARGDAEVGAAGGDGRPADPLRRRDGPGVVRGGAPGLPPEPLHAAGPQAARRAAVARVRARGLHSRAARSWSAASACRTSDSSTPRSSRTWRTWTWGSARAGGTGPSCSAGTCALASRPLELDRGGVRRAAEVDAGGELGPLPAACTGDPTHWLRFVAFDVLTLPGALVLRGCRGEGAGVLAKAKGILDGARGAEGDGGGALEPGASRLWP